MILEYRGLAKLKSTYTDKLPLMINPKTGRTYLLSPAVTATGRLSSTDPNLQNIPVRNEEGRRIRRAFIAPEDYVIVSADYCRLNCALWRISRDKGLLTAFAEGKISTVQRRQKCLVCHWKPSPASNVVVQSDQLWSDLWHECFRSGAAIEHSA